MGFSSRSSSKSVGSGALLLLLLLLLALLLLLLPLLPYQTPCYYSMSSSQQASEQLPFSYEDDDGGGATLEDTREEDSIRVQRVIYGYGKQRGRPWERAMSSRLPQQLLTLLTFCRAAHTVHIVLAEGCNRGWPSSTEVDSYMRSAVLCGHAF